MLKLILIILIFISKYAVVLGNENKSYEENCLWDNQSNIPCLQITSSLDNSSPISYSSINKTIITKKQIEQSGAVDLIDILKSVPDINITQSGPKGQQASLFMRGSGSNHTLVMINSIPINDQSTTQGLHDFGVDFIQTVQQIEIYPGSSSSHFGTNAIGGAINIILTGDYKNSFSLVSDNNLNYELSGNKTIVNNESSLNFKFGSIKNETISVRGKSDDEKDGVQNFTLNVNYEKFINENTKFFNTSYLRQTIAEYDNSDSNQSGYEGDNKMASFQFGLQNSIYNKKNDYVIYLNTYDREYDERGTIDSYESNVIGAKYIFSNNLNDQISFGFGSEYKYDWGYFDNNGSYSASTKGNIDNFSIFGNIGWEPFETVNFSIFTRRDKHKLTGNNSTFKLSFDKSFNDLNLGISHMTGLRNPTLYELFGTDNFGYSGNRNLKPEKSNTYEIYSNYSINENINFLLRAFKSNIKNNIEYINNQYQNDDDNIDLNQSGINNEINIKLENNSIKLFSSFLSSKKENNSDQLRRPEKNYGLIISKSFKKSFLKDFNLNLSYNHYGKHFDTHSSTFSTIEMDSTDLIDLKLSKKINNSNLFIKISNLLNENYQRPHGYNQEQRSIKFGLKY